MPGRGLLRGSIRWDGCEQQAVQIGFCPVEDDELYYGKLLQQPAQVAFPLCIAETHMKGDKLKSKEDGAGRKPYLR